MGITLLNYLQTTALVGLLAGGCLAWAYAGFRGQHFWRLWVQWFLTLWLFPVSLVWWLLRPGR